MEMDSTTVVLPGYTAKVDTVGNLLINPATRYQLTGGAIMTGTNYPEQ
jgi:hypothetical protein